MSSILSEGESSEDGDPCADSVNLGNPDIKRIKIGDPCSDYLSNPMFQSLHEKQRRPWSNRKGRAEKQLLLRGANITFKDSVGPRLNKELHGQKAMKNCKIL